MKRQQWLLVLVFGTALLPAGLSAQTKGSSEKGGIDFTGPYDVVENWFKPLREGWQECVLGVFAENPNRIYLVTEVEVPDTRPVGNCTSEREVAGARSHFILVLNSNGEVIEDWEQWDNLFGLPHSIKINPYDPEKHVWVINRDAHQIYEFTHDGKQLVMTLGEKNVSGNDDKHFNLPADIAFLPDGSFLVADGYGNARIVKFDRNGKYLTSWGTRGSGPGQFKVPHSVTVDGDQHVYVADRDNDRIEIFDVNGKYLDEWPDIKRVVFLMATRDRALWALSWTTNRLLKYDLSGRLQTYWGTADTKGKYQNKQFEAVLPGNLYAPHSFSVDSDGNLYIADYRNHRVQKFIPKANADPARLVGQPVR